MKRLLLILLLLPCLAWGETYYMSQSGDNTTGLAWAHAWRYIDSLNVGSFAGGDTVFIATGIWRESNSLGTEIATLFTISGSSGHPTVYACSSYFISPPTTLFAKIYGSEQVTSWTQIGTSNNYIANVSFVPVGRGLYAESSMCYLQADSGGVNNPAEWWYGNGHVVARLWNNADPNSYNTEIPQHTAINLASNSLNCDYVEIYGLSICYGTPNCITSYNYGDTRWSVSHTIIQDCFIAYPVGIYGVNPSDFQIGRCYNDGHGHCNYNRFIGNTFGSVHSVAGATPDYEWSGNGDGFTFYDMNYTVIEFNIFIGHFPQAQLYFKSGDMCSYDTVRYNVFMGDDGHGLRFYARNSNISVYGNVFISSDISFGCNAAYPPHDEVEYGPVSILNNTFYMTSSSRVLNEDCTIESHCSDGHYNCLNNSFKYNVIYTPSSTVTQYLRATTPYIDLTDVWPQYGVDSNMYYSPSGALAYSVDNSGQTWSNWHNIYKYDSLSTNNVDPSFDSLAWPFSRSAVAPEMDLTYGGNNWTRYGAWQSDIDTTTVRISSNTGWATIGVPRQHLVCGLDANSNISYWGNISGSYDSLFKFNNSGAITNRAGIYKDNEGGAHDYLSILADTIYIPVPRTDANNELIRFNANTFSAISQTTISMPGTGYYSEIQPSGITGKLVWLASNYSGSSTQYRFSTNYGANWGDWTVGPANATRHGLTVAGDSCAAVLYTGSEVNIWPYHTYDDTWTREAGTDFATELSNRIFSGIIAKDTVWVVCNTRNAVRVFKRHAGTGSITVDTLFFTTNAYSADDTYMGYEALSYNRALETPVIFYVHPDSGSTGIVSSKLYMRIWNGIDWGTDYCVSSGLQAYNLSAPYEVPTSHGNYVYCNLENANGENVVIVKINNITIEEEPPPADTTAPVISAVRDTLINYNSALILWITGESANSKVRYGLTNSYTDSSYSASLVTDHGLAMSGLQPNTIYHYRVESADAVGNLAIGSDRTLETLEEPSGQVIYFIIAR